MEEKAEEDEIECRVCRCGPETNRPLFYPCGCNGSIKYVHQDCLLQWLNRSSGGSESGNVNHSNVKKSHCELCNQPFTFKPIYKPGAPKYLGPIQLFSGISLKFKRFYPKVIRILIVLGMWGTAMPLSTLYCYKIFLSRSSLEAKRTFREMFSYFNRPKDLPGDILLGMALCILIICITSAFSHIFKECKKYTRKKLREQREKLRRIREIQMRKKELSMEQAVRDVFVSETRKRILIQKLKIRYQIDGADEDDQMNDFAKDLAKDSIKRFKMIRPHEFFPTQVENHPLFSQKIYEFQSDCSSKSEDGSIFDENESKDDQKHEIENFKNYDCEIKYHFDSSRDNDKNVEKVAKILSEVEKVGILKNSTKPISENLESIPIYKASPRGKGYWESDFLDSESGEENESNSFSSESGTNESDDKSNQIGNDGPMNDSELNRLEDRIDENEGFENEAMINDAEVLDNNEGHRNDEIPLLEENNRQPEVEEELAHNNVIRGNIPLHGEDADQQEGNEQRFADDEILVNLAEIIGLEGPIGPAIDAAIHTALYNFAFMAIIFLVPFWVGMFICSKYLGYIQLPPEMPLSVYQVLDAMTINPWSNKTGNFLNRKIAQTVMNNAERGSRVKNFIQTVSNLKRPGRVSSGNLFQDISPVKETLQIWADFLTLHVGWLAIIVASIPVIIGGILFLLHFYGGGLPDLAKLTADSISKSIGLNSGRGERVVNEPQNRYAFNFLKKVLDKINTFCRSALLQTKATLLIASELITMPYYLGWVIDLSTLRLFGVNLSDRIESETNKPILSFATHVGIGVFFMISIGFLTKELKKMVKEEYLKKVFPMSGQADANNNEIMEIFASQPLMGSIKKLIVFFFKYLMLVVICISIPSRLPGTISPKFGELKFTFATGFMLEIQLPMEMLIFHVVLPTAIERGYLRQGFFAMLKSWLCWLCKSLEIEYIIEPSIYAQYNAADQPHYQLINGDERDGQSLEEAGDVGMFENVKNLPKLLFKKFDSAIRIAVFVSVNAIIALVGCTYIIHVPVRIGRLVFFLLNFQVENDIYSIAVGLIISWAAFTFASLLRWHLIITRIQGVSLLQFLSFWTVIMLKWSVLAATWLGAIPLLIGFYFEALIGFPYKSAPGDTPKISLFQNWAMGLVFLKIWVRIIFLNGGGGPNAVANPEEGPAGLMGHRRWARRFERIKARGIRDVEFMWIFIHVCCNVLNKVGFFYFVPYFISRGIVPYLTSDPYFIDKSYRFGHCWFLMAHLSLNVFLRCVRLIKELHNSIWEDNFLEGITLTNSAYHQNQALVNGDINTGDD